MKRTRYRAAIRRCHEGSWEAINDVRPGFVCFFRNTTTGRQFARQIER